MKPGMKMLMLNKGRESLHDSPERRGEYRDAQMEYGGSKGNYSGMNNRSNYSRNEYENEMRDMENRFRGGERYSDRSDERMNYPRDNVYDMESRRRFPRHKDGTFAPRSGMSRTEPYKAEARHRTNPIGFVPTEYDTYATHKRMDEMERRSSDMEHGGAYGESLTEEMAHEWMNGLENADGTKGAHWTIEQTKQVMSQRNMTVDPLEFWVVINSIYADYCKVLQRHNMNKVDVYADLAKAWIEDKDAVENKAAVYYDCIVQK